MKTLAQVDALIKSKREALKALTAPFMDAQGEPLEGFPLAESKTAREEIGVLQAEYDELAEAKSLVVENAEALKAQATNVTQYSHGTDASTSGNGGSTATKTLVLPARAKKYRGNAFKNDQGRPDAEQAYKFGMWCLAALTGAEGPKKFCKDFGIGLTFVKEEAKAGSEYKVGLENINAQGGFLVPDEFDAALIDLREQYGVFRPNARMRTMGSDTRRVPRRTGGVTAYFVGEDAAITESTKTWDSITLVAKKLAALCKFSNELNEDAIIDIGNDLAQEIAYAFGVKEDDCGFNGDGTSTYGGIVGLIKSFLNLSGTIANIAGLQVATGTGYATDYSSVVLGDFNKTMGRLPQYADTDRTAWYCNKSFFNSVMQRLEFAGGGNTEINIAKGNRDKMFLGYPVHVTQIMPANSAVSQIACFFGDLSLAADFGDRRQTTIAMSEHAGFANDELQIRGTERFDVVVHDVGNQSGTAALRVAGPMVGLITASS